MVQPLTFKDAVYYGLKFEMKRKTNLHIKHPVTDEDTIVSERHKNAIVDIGSEEANTGFSAVYNGGITASFGVGHSESITGLDNLPIKRFDDMYGLSQVHTEGNHKGEPVITGVHSINRNGEIVFDYSDGGPGNFFWGQYGRNVDNTKSQNPNSKNLEEHAIIISSSYKDKDPKMKALSQHVISLLNLDDKWITEEEDRAAAKERLGRFRREWSSESPVTDIKLDEELTGVIVGDISFVRFYEGEPTPRTELEFKLTAKDWDSFVKLKAYLYEEPLISTI